jgi:hypothetical protein
MAYTISKCPACGSNDFEVVKFRCTSCGTLVEGSFSISRLANLSAENLHFVETFIRCRGNIKEVERELGISYPTVRNRLDKVVALMGGKAEGGTKRRREILSALEKNEMTPNEAVAALKEAQD